MDLVRLLPYWESDIKEDLKAGKTVLVTAHGNSLRALVKHLDGISDDAIASLIIAASVALVLGGLTTYAAAVHRRRRDADAAGH